MKNFGLKTRLILVIGFLALLMIGVGLLGYKGLTDGERALETTYADQVLPLIHLKVVYDSYAVAVDNECHKLADSVVSWEEGRKNIAAATARADRAWKSYLETSHGGEEKRLVDEALPLAKSLEAAMERLADILQKEDRDRLKTFNSTDLYRTIDPFCTKLNELSDVQGKEVATTIAEAGRTNRTMGLTLLVSIIAAVALAGVLGFNLVRLAGDLVVLVGQVQKSGLQVNTSINEIAATAKEQQATAVSSRA